MLPVGPRPVRCAVVGEGTLDEALATDDDDAAPALTVERVPPSRGGRRLADVDADCVVVDGAAVEPNTAAVVDRATTDLADVPVLAVTADWRDDRVADVLSAGAASAVPRTLADADPERLRSEVRSAVEREHAQTSFAELYDNVSGLATLHDPDTGEMVHANRSLCDHLGYDRGELLSMDIGDFTADVAGYDHERAMNLAVGATDRDDPLETDWPLVTADGDVRWVEATLRPVEIGGRELVLSTSVDITDRRRQERKYRAVFDNVNDVITVHDPWDEELVDVNETLCELTGYGRDALREMGVDGFSVTDDGYTSDRAYDIQREVAATGDTETTDWKIETAAGDHRLLETVLSPATIAGEDRVLVLARDVTERRELEETYRGIFENVSDGLVVYDPETGEIEDANGRFCEMHGYEREALLGEPIYVFSDSAEAEQRARSRIEAAREEGSQLFESRNRRKDGTTYPVEIHLTVVEIHGEERVLGSVRDITERKRREREYEQIFNGVQDAIVVHDPQTKEMVDVNETFCELLGYDRETLLELGTAGVSVGDEGFTQERAEAIIDEVMAEGRKGPFEWKVETSDGEQRVMEVVATTAEIGGELRHVSINRDVTERKRREREYEQIFDGVNDAIVIQDPETADVLDANETFLQRLGYEDVQAVREAEFNELSAADAGYTKERAREICQRVAETGDPETVEWQQETRDGERRWIEAKVDTAEIRGQRRIVSMQRDVTERKRREREYEQIFNGVNDIVNVYDPETGDLVAVNDTMCELSGYDREQLLEHGVGLVSAADEGFTQERAEAVIDEVMAAGEPKTFDWRLETADGDVLALDVQAAPATIGGEQRLLTISRDVTERRRTEKRLEAVLDRIDEAIFMTRATAVTAASQAPDYVSSGYEDIWGEPLETIREEHEDGFFETIHRDDRAEYRAFVEDVVDDVTGGDPDDRYAVEYRIERPDGEVRWVHSDFYPTEWDGGPPRVVIVSRDVTDRKARERRIASFDDATDDLATAETPSEATRLAVDAATETLDLPAVGTFLYDDEDGVLRPEVLTGPLPDSLAEPVGPGDGPLWDGFAAGTIVASDGGERERGFVGRDADAPASLADLGAWRALTLGNHGVLLVASRDDALDAETIQAAHVLAATLEAALNHLQGQREVSAHKEQLRTQTARADRLDRIARLTQQVEAAITEASNPGEVEAAVCERLATAGPYDLAWVGGPDVGTDRLTARAVAGAPPQHVEELGLVTTDDTADPHPALRAWRTDDVQVTDSLVADGPAGTWRQYVLSAGVQSLCAVPLTYDGVTHGVLTVGTETPNEFGERERDVLGQLGQSIANALAAIERRRALESDETVELEFRGDGDALPFARAAAEAGCRVRHERTVAGDDGQLTVYYSLAGDVPDGAVDAVRETVPGAVDVVAEESSTLVAVETTDWFGSPLAEYGGVLRDAVADPSETTVVVEVPRQADVRSFVERLQADAPSLELAATRQHRRRDRTPAELRDEVRGKLTDRQYEVLETALSAGYFEWPRENDGSDVADRLGITQPTLNKHLRLAEKQIFEFLLDDRE